MNILRKALLSAKTIGLKNSLLAIQNARRRDQLEARYPLIEPEANPQSPGSLVSAQAIPAGGSFQFTHLPLEVRFLQPDFLFIAWGGAQMLPSYAVVQADWPDIESDLQQTEDGWWLHSGALALHISTMGELRLYNPQGDLLRHDAPPIQQGAAWSQRTPLPAEAHIYGLGERSHQLNLRPGTYRFWNSEAGGTYGLGADPLYICMPLYLCLQETACYLVFYDNVYDATLHLDQQAEMQFTGGPLRSYIAVGSPEALLEKLTALTGRAPLPPRWAFGYAQSKWGYRTEAEMRRIYQGFRQNSLPISVLYLDGDHMRGYRTLTPDDERYPTLARFSQELAEEDIHLVASTNPAIKVEKGFDLYEQGLKEDAYCKTPAGQVTEGVVWPGWAAFTDFTNPRVRQWWGQQYARSLLRGVDGFWHDMNEPSNFTAWGELTLPLCTQHDLEGRGGDHREAHNIYGMQMNRAGYEGLRQLRPDRRPFILSRSGWVGMQRYSWAWTGDVETSWDMLRQTLACVIGLGLSGVPYCGPDIGGFSGAPSPELYLRWFQLASFLPFFRTHCAIYLPNREPWEFGEHLPTLRGLLQQRYRLMPYWYTLAWQTTQKGCPPVRPLFWDEPQNAELWDVGDAFLLGDALLIAPIMDEGALSRSLRLPAGSWYEMSSDRLHEGHKSIDLQAPLAEIPVLVRAGSILPMLEGRSIRLHIYAPVNRQEGRGLLYSDQGEGYGSHRLDMFSLQPVDDMHWEFSWNSAGEYAWPYPETHLVLHGFGKGPATTVPVQPGQALQLVG
ncbi:MAG: hypothetical protein JXB15_09705 [Anaerolineales bacterium]|nr:hypothetical protein [Anaerolineales bacterium]